MVDLPTHDDVTFVARTSCGDVRIIEETYVRAWDSWAQILHEHSDFEKAVGPIYMIDFRAGTITDVTEELAAEYLKDMAAYESTNVPYWVEGTGVYDAWIEETSERPRSDREEHGTYWGRP